MMVNTFEAIKCKGVELADDQKSIIMFSQMITKFEKENKSKLIRFQCPLLGISLQIDMHRKISYILVTQKYTICPQPIPLSTQRG